MAGQAELSLVGSEVIDWAGRVANSEQHVGPLGADEAGSAICAFSAVGSTSKAGQRA